MCNITFNMGQYRTASHKIFDLKGATMKVIIWGTGNLAQKIMKEGITGKIVGFLETKKSKESFEGYPVYGIEEIPEDYDYIVVANSFSDEIYEACIEYRIDMNKVVFINAPKRVAFNAGKVLREVLGERNYTRYVGQYRDVWENTFIEEDMAQYSRMNRRKEFEIKKEYFYPIVYDKYEMNSGMSEYFWQDLWAAKHIISQGVKEHFDIGSRVDGFIAHLLAANIKVNMIDIRPFPGTAENLSTVVDDATMLKNFQDNSIHSLSALCSLEHFGLGRYGDSIDPEACFKCFNQIQKKLVMGGKLYLSVPIGQDRVEFNAHRVFYAETIVKSFSGLKLCEYSAIVNKQIEYHVDIHKYDKLDKERIVGLFMFEK